MNIAAERNLHKAQQQFRNTFTVLLAALAYFIAECILADEGCVYTRTEPMMKTQYFPFIINETSEVEIRWHSSKTSPVSHSQNTTFY